MAVGEEKRATFLNESTTRGRITHAAGSHFQDDFRHSFLLTSLLFYFSSDLHTSFNSSSFLVPALDEFAIPSLPFLKSYSSSLGPRSRRSICWPSSLSSVQLRPLLHDIVSTDPAYLSTFGRVVSPCAQLPPSSFVCGLFPSFSTSVILFQPFWSRSEVHFCKRKVVCRLLSSVTHFQLSLVCFYGPTGV